MIRVRNARRIDCFSGPVTCLLLNVSGPTLSLTLPGIVTSMVNLHRSINLRRFYLCYVKRIELNTDTGP